MDMCVITSHKHLANCDDQFGVRTHADYIVVQGLAHGPVLTSLYRLELNIVEEAISIA